MRKHDVRKWLHAVLDLLPVILIPVFMIYSHRHDVSQDFVKTEEVPVYYDTNEVVNVDDILIGNYYRWNNDYVYNGSTNTRVLEILNNTALQNQLNIDVQYNDCQTFLTNNYQINYLKLDFYRSGSYVNGIVLTNQVFDFNVVAINNVEQLQLLIPHITECETLYVKSYQEVTITIPKDVMTSFMDRFNNSIAQYFNMGNVFNLNGVYEWFNTNIFSGNAPTVIYSIWNIALYELVMDLLFLLYGLFMWFIDMVEHLMEKPFKSIK